MGLGSGLELGLVLGLGVELVLGLLVVLQGRGEVSEAELLGVITR